MPGYTTRLLTLRLGGLDYRIRALSDLQQVADPKGYASIAGISSSNWSLFGQVWPAGCVLAQTMSSFEVAGKRILELGCGLGLASLVLNRRKADITASDHHPLAEEFLAYNAALNGLQVPAYLDLAWSVPQPTLGRFDLIIASDVLYERGHAEQLSGLMKRHAKPESEVLITDPGRGNSGAFTSAMRLLGYGVDEVRSAFNDLDLPPYRGRLLSYRR
jgi:2-polyprenyl-3-methyl-5-hydroxy-6-metoxy-1,4-benzoquinol methylase